MKVRLEDKIQFVNKIASFSYSIAPLSVQILIENAIKHNIATNESPLIITLEIKEKTLWVRNNLQLRTTKETSTNIGLKNLKDRYAYLSNTPVQIIQNNQNFEVGIPLL